MVKRFILLATLALFGVFVFAQDVIMLKTGDDIEALIEKVGAEEIEYKKWDNQAGPVYVIKKSDVFMIKYRNGAKDVFDTPAKPVQTQVEQPKQTPSTSITPSTPLTPLTSSSNLQAEFYNIGNDDKAMLEFFRRNQMAYYNQFNQACKMKKTANALLGTGLGITAAGVIFHIAGKKAVNDAEKSSSLNDVVSNVQKANVLLDTGSTLMVMGGLSTIGSIPVYAVSASKKKAIKNDFAREYFGVINYTYQPKLNLGTTANGIGLTLNF